MWRILKAELKYNSSTALGAYIFGFLLFIGSLFPAQKEVRVAIIMFALLCTPMIAGYFGDYRIHQKKDRFHTTLPIPGTHLGIIRLIYPLLFWLSLIVVFYATVFTLSWIRAFGSPRSLDFSWIDIPSIPQMIVLNGWILMINALYLIFSDLDVTSRERTKQLFMKGIKYIMPFVAMFPFWAYMMSSFSDYNMFFEKFIKDLWYFPSVIIGINVLGLTLSIISIFIFTRRSSFIE
jgi:hypothetical protein